MPGSEIERVNPDALDGVPAEPTTAAEKILRTLRELSSPGEEADETELMLGTVCMGLERGLGEQIGEYQNSGELDEFVLALTRFLALHRSDSAKLLVVVELPRHERLDRRMQISDIPAGTRLRVLDEAIAAMATATSPL